MHLSNPVESLENVKRPEKYREHITRVDELLDKDVAKAIRRAVK